LLTTDSELAKLKGVKSEHLGTLVWNLAQSCIKDAASCDATRRNDRGTI